MLGMLSVYGIHDTLPAFGKRLIAMKQMLYRLWHIHHRGHLLHLVIPIGATLSQQPYPVHRQTIRSGAQILEIRQPSCIDKLLDIPRLQHGVKQSRQSLPTQSAGCGRQSQEPCLRPSFP